MGEQDSKNNTILSMINILIKVFLRIWQLPQYLISLIFFFRADRSVVVGWRRFKVYYLKGDTDYYFGELNFSHNRRLWKAETAEKAYGYVVLSRISGIFYPFFVLRDADRIAFEINTRWEGTEEAKKRSNRAIRKVVWTTILLWLFVAVVAYFLGK